MWNFKKGQFVGTALKDYIHALLVGQALEGSKKTNLIASLYEAWRS